MNIVHIRTWLLHLIIIYHSIRGGINNVLRVFHFFTLLFAELWIVTGFFAEHRLHIDSKFRFDVGTNKKRIFQKNVGIIKEKRTFFQKIFHHNSKSVCRNRDIFLAQLKTLERSVFAVFFYFLVFHFHGFTEICISTCFCNVFWWGVFLWA